ncbi:septum formation initiator family protein [Clostridium rectalis]|uniref:septum formation initiator family protein n=1 Tax=Clostridium rectalis TaxID=2040295 RepID=UPI000F62CC2F|nr:septum formation initiator family protein [Clostridium rectalis]
MIVSGNEEYIRGNTALAPQVEPEIKKEKSKKKQNRSKILKKKNKSIQKKAKTIKSISIAFIIGVALLSRYSYIYNMQQNLNNINKGITKLNKNNENLKVELVKYNNIQYIEDIATKKLKMTKPSKNSIVYCDLNKEVFKNQQKSDVKKTEENIFKKWFSKLF